MATWDRVSDRAPTTVGTSTTVRRISHFGDDWWSEIQKGDVGSKTQVTAWPNLGKNKVNHCGFTARVAASLISLLSIFWRWWWRRNDRLCLRVWSVPYVASNVVGNGSGRQVGFWVRLGFKSSFSPSLSRVHSLSLK